MLEILRILDLVAVGAMTVERARGLRAALTQMQAEGCEPSEAEWTALLATIDADTARLEGSN